MTPRGTRQTQYTNRLSPHELHVRALAKQVGLWRAYATRWVKRALKAEAELALLERERGGVVLGEKQENVGRAMGVQRQNDAKR